VRIVPPTGAPIAELPPVGDDEPKTVLTLTKARLGETEPRDVVCGTGALGSPAYADRPGADG